MHSLLNPRALLGVLCLGLAAFCALHLGCGPGGPSPEQQRIAQLEQAQHQLEAARQRAEAERQAAEARRQNAEAQRRRWQVYTILAGALGLVLLVLGAGLGAQTRRDADPREPPHGQR